MFVRLIGLFCLSLCISAAIFAQIPPGEKKEENETLAPETEKKAIAVLEQTLSEADALKLGENRIYVFAAMTDLLWERDEKRARAIARKVAAEIREAFDQSDEIENYGNQISFFAQDQRRNFLINLANHDAEFALELLEQTRPPNIQNLLNAPPGKSRFANNNNELDTEYNLEQAIVSHLTAKNPRRVLQTARKMMEKGLLSGVLNLVIQLKATDAAAAQTLAAEIVQKANSISLADNQNQYFIASLLAQFAPSNAPNNAVDKDNKPLFSQNDLRGLAEKLANYYLNVELNQSNYYSLDYANQVLSKYLPAQAAQIKQRGDEARKIFQSSNKEWDEVNKFSQTAAPETLLAEVDNYPSNFRQNIYNSAANKFAEAGNFDRARQTLASISKSNGTNSLLDNFDRQTFQRFIGNGKIDDARRVLSQITSKTTRVELLVQLAAYLQGKNEKEAALQTLDEARNLINPTPENAAELRETSEVIRAYTTIAPKNAFNLLEPLIDQANEIIAATALISKYQPYNQGFRDGEFQIVNGFPPCATSFLGVGDFGILSKNDFERTLQIADRIQRPEIRLAVRLEILQSVLASGSKAVSGGEIYNLPINGRRISGFGGSCG